MWRHKLRSETGTSACISFWVGCFAPSNNKTGSNSKELDEMGQGLGNARGGLPRRGSCRMALAVDIDGYGDDSWRCIERQYHVQAIGQWQWNGGDVKNHRGKQRCACESHRWNIWRIELMCVNDSLLPDSGAPWYGLWDPGMAIAYLKKKTG